ncbi:MAG: hypothetical protein IKO14_00815 [Oscillibacter sp.]|nr:hypothetical protein [Oscillibacter sp.]
MIRIIKIWLSQVKQGMEALGNWLDWLICGREIELSGKSHYGNSPFVRELYHSLSPDDDGYLVYYLRNNLPVRIDLSRKITPIRPLGTDCTSENVSPDDEYVNLIREKGSDSRYHYYLKNVSFPTEILVNGESLSKLSQGDSPQSPGHELHVGNVITFANLQLTFLRRLSALSADVNSTMETKRMTAEPQPIGDLSMKVEGV